MSTYTIDSGYYRALVRERDVWKERAEAAERQLAETREALAGLLDDLPVIRNAADPNRMSSVRKARALAVSPADTTEDGR